MIQESVIKDPALAPEGHRKIDWVAQHSPVLNTISKDRLADGALRGRKVVTPRLMNAAHDRGVRVDVWTIDEPGEMHRLLDLGVDVIMTNRPEVLEGVLGERR